MIWSWPRFGALDVEAVRFSRGIYRATTVVTDEEDQVEATIQAIVCTM